MSHQFTKVYKTWSDLELFQLLQNKDDYQEEAVEAAEAEMNSRKLSESELGILLKKHEEEQSKKQNTAEKKLARAIESNKEKLIADLDPFSENTINRHIRLLCYGVAFIILYNFINDYRWFNSILRYGWPDSAIILSLMPYLFVPIGIFYFWRRQKFGWSIFTIWFVLSIVIIIKVIYGNLTWPMIDILVAFSKDRAYLIICFC